MKKLANLGLALVLALGLAAAAQAADETTVSGKVVCAKCSLKKADAAKCQDVLVVSGEKAAEYYVEKNAVSEKFGHVCGGSKEAVVTGVVTEKDGKKWIAPSKMEAPKQS
jgi:hypothetical protein